MTASRRQFLQWSATAALAGAGLDLAATPTKATAKAGKLKILILGGTGFLGPATIEAAQARGHQVTMFNRGKTRPELFPGVEKLHGDRDPKKGEGLKALEQGTWDAVIDNSAYYPRMVAASAGLLAPRIRQYLLISSISAYKEPNPEAGTEDAALATMPDPTLEDMGKSYEYYGALKALCEQAAQKALPGRTTVIRPGYIVGPDDPSGRFTYWPARFDRGGEVAVPGAPSDPLQIIDVRDLATWLVLLVEQRTLGRLQRLRPCQAPGLGHRGGGLPEGGQPQQQAHLAPHRLHRRPEGPGVPHLGPLCGRDQGLPHLAQRPRREGRPALPPRRTDREGHPRLVPDPGEAREGPQQARGPHRRAGSQAAGGVAREWRREGLAPPWPWVHP